MKTLKVFKKNLIGLQGELLKFGISLTADKDAAMDLIQDTNLKTLSNRSKFVDNRNFKGWVFTIMRNIFVNSYYKKMRAYSLFEQNDNLYNLDLSENTGLDTPDGAFDYWEITNILNNLDDGCKIPFSMHIAGYKYTEIADGLGVPLGTVKSRIFHARRRLQFILIAYKS